MNQADEYDRQYRVWVERMGPQALDLEARLAGLLWRQRVLLRRYPPRGLRVLDFGCMDGVFTIALERAGARAVGFDVSPAAIAQAIRFRGAAGGPEFSTAPPAGGAFDLVFCNEVIEHIEDDRAFAGHLVGFLRPGGRLVGTTPVGRSFWDPDHKREYNERNLAAALEPWGRVRLRRYYRSPLRNLLPFHQQGAAVFIFEVQRHGVAL